MSTTALGKLDFREVDGGWFIVELTHEVTLGFISIDEYHMYDLKNMQNEVLDRDWNLNDLKERITSGIHDQKLTA